MSRYETHETTTSSRKDEEAMAWRRERVARVPPAEWGHGGVLPQMCHLMKNVFFGERHASENALHGLVVISVSTFSVRWNNKIANGK